MNKHENKKIILIDPQGDINPFELVENNAITTEKIIENMLLIIECTKVLNQHFEPNDILKEICNKNNLELSDINKNEILRTVQIEIKSS